MSTCPDKDIHSVYLDNELPGAYVAEYESHLASCQSCRAQVERLRSLRAALAQDSASISLGEDALRQGFDRLSARLSYSRVVKKSTVVPFRAASFVRPVAAGIAAALVVAVALPLRSRSAGGSAESSFQPIAKSALISPASRPVMFIDQEISSVNLESLLEADVPPVQMVSSHAVMATEAAYSAGGSLLPFTQSAARAAPANFLTSYDVFTPPSVSQPPAATEEKGTFSVEFSLGSFHFKAQGTGK